MCTNSLLFLHSRTLSMHGFLVSWIHESVQQEGSALLFCHHKFISTLSTDVNVLNGGCKLKHVILSFPNCLEICNFLWTFSVRRNYHSFTIMLGGMQLIPGEKRCLAEMSRCHIRSCKHLKLLSIGITWNNMTWNLLLSLVPLRYPED